MKRYGLLLLLNLFSLSPSLFLLSCSGESNRPRLILVPDEQMNALGEEAYIDILSKSRLSLDSRVNRDVEEIGQRIAQASGADYDWEFNVIVDDQANAFCLPGGKVAVYTGIVPFAKTNAGLAAVMGHEVAHALLRHSAERVSENYLLQMGLSLANLSFQNSPYKDLLAAALGLGSQVGIELPFSRFQEQEADRVGLELMAKAGYDPREAIGLWERMEAGAGDRPPEILSTHPDPKDRIKELNEDMNKALEIYDASAKVETTPL